MKSNPFYFHFIPSGDVTFGSGLRLEGDVNIQAEGALHIENNEQLASFIVKNNAML